MSKAPVVLDKSVTIYKVPLGSLQIINRFHRSAQSAAVQTAVYAALCGMELARARRLVPHGGWDHFVKDHCEFTPRTATNYMAFAEAIKERLSNRKLVSDLPNLATLVPSELSPEQQEALFALVALAVDGARLVDLYREFGIVRRIEGGPTGGYKVNETLVQTFLRAYHAALLGKPYAELPAEVQEHFRRWMRQVEASDTQMSLDFYEVTVSRFDEYAPKRAEIIDRMPTDEARHLRDSLKTWVAALEAKLS